MTITQYYDNYICYVPGTCRKTAETAKTATTKFTTRTSMSVSNRRPRISNTL